MNYLPLQIIITLFVIFVVFRQLKKYRDNSFKISEFLSWLLLWAFILLGFWLPQSTSYLADIFGIGRGVDLAIYCAVLLIFYLIFRVYLKLDRQQKEITKIIRHLALKDKENNQEKNNHA